jgi:hypothetical protein
VVGRVDPLGALGLGDQAAEQAVTLSLVGQQVVVVEDRAEVLVAVPPVDPGVVAGVLGRAGVGRGGAGQTSQHASIPPEAVKETAADRDFQLGERRLEVGEQPL